MPYPERLLSNGNKYRQPPLSQVCQSHKPRGMSHSLHPKQIRQWQSHLLIYTFLPLARLCLGWRREQGVPLRIKRPRKACPWPQLSLLAEDQTYSKADLLPCFLQDWQAWVQITISELNPAGGEPLGLSLNTWPPETPGTWARLPWSLFRSCWRIGFWARTYSKMRRRKDHQTLTRSLNHDFL